MPFSTETVQAGEYVLVRYEGTIGGHEFHQAHAAVKKQLNVHGWGRLLVDLRKIENRIDAGNVYSYAKRSKDELPWISFALLYPPHGMDDFFFAEDFKRHLRLKSFTDHETALAWLVNPSGTRGSEGEQSRFRGAKGRMIHFQEG